MVNNIHPTFTGGVVEVQQYTQQEVTFDSSPTWLDSTAAQAHVLQYNLQVGGHLYDSTTTAFSVDTCAVCAPGLVCDGFITE